MSMSALSFNTCFDFCSSYQGRITNQLYRLGCSYDWDRVAFTMNEVCSPFSSLKISNVFFLESQQSSHRNFL
jgi:valyl-tRNA synthetase